MVTFEAFGVASVPPMRTPACTLRLRELAALATLLAATTSSLAACGTDAPEQGATGDPAVVTTPAATAPSAATATTTTDQRDEATPTPTPSGAVDEAVSDGADESIAGNTDTSAPDGTVDSAPGVGDAKVPIVTADQTPVTIRVQAGDLVAFRAVSGSDEQVSIQNYGKPYPVSAGVSRIIRFKATKTGSFAIVFGEMDKLVGTLVVEE
jgi:hypothetical protein